MLFLTCMCFILYLLARSYFETIRNQPSAEIQIQFYTIFGSCELVILIFFLVLLTQLFVK